LDYVLVKKPFRIMENTTNHTLQWNEFEKVEMRIGTILEARDFPEARKPAYQLAIDFGNEIGIRKSSAQITKRYAIEDMVGKQVVAVVNFPKKQIGNFMSECLVLGSVNGDDIVLLTSDLKVENGLRVG
jgi:tRNA-binding protein